MNREILLIAEQIKDAYAGDPWFGRSVRELLHEVPEEQAFEHLNGQHSIVELLWHMITWKQFVLSRLRKDDTHKLHYYEALDWRQIDPADRKAWKEGLELFDQLHRELVDVIQQQTDDLLPLRVPERLYDYRKLLYGILEHDVYHIGQIAYIVKVLSGSTS